jgi:hypothetical protein
MQKTLVRLKEDSIKDSKFFSMVQMRYQNARGRFALSKKKQLPSMVS